MIFRLLALTIIALLSFPVVAKKKENPKAEIKVSYNYHHLTLRNDGEVSPRDYVYMLLANPQESKYYNYQNEYLDSLDSTPSGRALSRQMMSAALQLYIEKGDDSAIPRSRGHLWVFKSFQKGQTTVYDAYGLMERGFYTEPHAEIEWQLSDSTKNILGYECVMAQTDYHGRHWTAWFAPDIPIHDGPWKLCGLPGLILEASDTTGQHSFTATGIEKSNMEMFPIYEPSKYDKMKRIDMLKAYASYRKNAGTYERQLISEGPDGGTKIEMAPTSIPKANTQNIDFLETDYHSH